MTLYSINIYHNFCKGKEAKAGRKAILTVHKSNRKKDKVTEFNKYSCNLFLSVENLSSENSSIVDDVI